MTQIVVRFFRAAGREAHAAIVGATSSIVQPREERGEILFCCKIGELRASAPFGQKLRRASTDTGRDSHRMSAISSQISVLNLRFSEGKDRWVFEIGWASAHRRRLTRKQRRRKGTGAQSSTRPLRRNAHAKTARGASMTAPRGVLSVKIKNRAGGVSVEFGR